MKLVVQRVKEASVTIDNKLYSSVQKGLLVLFGVEKDDSEDMLEYYAQKLLKLRIFEDENGKMNKSVCDTGGEILVVSQFTLCADCKKGTRPSFDNAKEPKTAKEYYEKFVQILTASGLSVKTGVFAAHMDVSLVNCGPVTIIL
ncbi:TPA: D-tyrosyl-tRNA(Tyr) deacylase [Candidatus Galligastranaerophilus faecipullorum]|nr:D-tyrosyl-tRNA(Tyr) deacylase [Candidatus Galligastranaerophilus faecipullorum]